MAIFFGIFFGIIFAFIAAGALGIIALFFACDAAAEREREGRNNRDET